MNDPKLLGQMGDTVTIYLRSNEKSELVPEGKAILHRRIHINWWSVEFLDKRGERYERWLYK